MESIRSLIEQMLVSIGMSPHYAEKSIFVFLLLCLGFISWLAGYIAHRFITPVILKIVEKTETVLDDYFFNRPVLKALWHVVPSIIFYLLLPQCYTEKTSPTAINLISGATRIYITLTIILLIKAFLSNLVIYSNEQDKLKSHHLIGIIQFLKLLTYLIGAIIIMAFLMGENPMGLIAGLGAAATVLMFIFKDTILGLVAGIQLSTNKMLKPGDWITIEKLNINGIVEEVSLVTVKVRNFDNTICTVPPYTLVSDTFQNWDGMKMRHARRVKRALYIDVNSIRKLTEDETTQLMQHKIITSNEIEKAGTPPINLALFRHYIERLLINHPEVIHQETWQWLMARQLEPTPNGLPIELWFYFKEIEFVRYEALTAALMEQIIANIPNFYLRLFQSPTGSDIAKALSSGTIKINKTFSSDCV